MWIRPKCMVLLVAHAVVLAGCGGKSHPKEARVYGFSRQDYVEIMSQGPEEHRPRDVEAMADHLTTKRIRLILRPDGSYQFMKRDWQGEGLRADSFGKWTEDEESLVLTPLTPDRFDGRADRTLRYRKTAHGGLIMLPRRDRPSRFAHAYLAALQDHD